MKKADYDCWGHCVITGKPLYTEKVIDGEVQKVPTPDMTHMTMLLEDGSLMRVCVSKQAKKLFKSSKESLQFIMNKVIKGWDKETDELVKDGRWDKERKQKYMKEYSKKKILDRIDDIPYRSLSNVEAEVNKVRKKLLKEARNGIN